MKAALKNRDGTPRAETPRLPLATDRVRHVGDPVAFIVAESLQQNILNNKKILVTFLGKELYEKNQKKLTSSLAVLPIES